MSGDRALQQQLTVPPETIAQAQLHVFGTLAKNLEVPQIKLEDFFLKGWPIIEPATPLQNRWYVGYLAEHLEAVQLGQIKKLVVSIHPRSAKSNLITILAPCWMWTLEAWKRFMFVSYSKDLAVEHSLKRRRVISSSWFHENWGGMIQLMGDQNRQTQMENTARGMMIGAGAGGTATGKGANLLVFDDFINPKEASSEAERKNKIDLYQNTFSSRLNNPEKDAMIVTAQRTHSNDLTGHVLKEGGWTHVELPIVCEKRTVYVFPLSKKEHVREPGDVLNPTRHPPAILEDQKKKAGSRGWSSQWMCAPSSDAGNMVKRHWWKFYHEDPRVKMTQVQVAAQSWDFSFKNTEDSSFVSGLIGGLLNADIILAAEVHQQMDFTQTCAAVESTSSQWPMTTYKFYEDKANGPAIKSHLQKKVAGLLPVPPLGSKEARMAAASPMIESGNVLLPYPWDKDGAVLPEFQWVLDFIEELARFPEEPNDRGDALSQLIIKLMNVEIYVQQESEVGGQLMDADGESMDFGTLDLGGLEHELG